jgi:hypothetical protein
VTVSPLRRRCALRAAQTRIECRIAKDLAVPVNLNAIVIHLYTIVKI